MKSLIILITFLFSINVIAEEKKSDKKTPPLKKEEKTSENKGFGPQKKSDRVPPSKYKGGVLNLIGGVAIGDAGQTYTNRTGSTVVSTGEAGGTSIEALVNAQLAYMFKGVYLGFDGRVGTGAHEEIKYDALSAFSNEDSSTSVSMSVGTVIGYEFNFGLRLYAGYSPFNNLLLSGKSGSTEYIGTSTKFGIDYLMESGIGYGLQIVKNIYDEREGVKLPSQLIIGANTIDIGKLDNREIIFYIHFPIQLTKK